MTFIEQLRAERRRYILDILDRSQPSKLNHRSVAVILEQYGLRPADEELRRDLQWLYQTGLVELEHLDNLVLTALTERGRDVSAGRLRIDGISRDGICGDY